MSEHLKDTEGESPKVSQTKHSVSASLEQRLVPEDVNSTGKVAYVASFLGPRHKHLRFTSGEVKGAVKVWDLSSSAEEMAAVKSEETELTAKTPQSDVSDSAITVLIGKDHKVESTDTTTELNQ